MRRWEIIKRTSDGIIKSIDWNLCIVCQRNDPNFGKLQGSRKERDTLVGNLKIIWDIGKEKVDISCYHHSFIRSNNGSPDFKTTFEYHNAVFHHRCTGEYSKQKVDQLKKQQKKNKECTVLTRSSSSNKPMGSPFCAICDKKDDESKLQPAGTQGATKDTLDIQHNAKLLKRWENMAIKTNNNLLLAKLATGSLAFNELFYHLDCYSSMSQNYQGIRSINEGLPNLHSSRRKDGKTIVMFDQQVDNLIRDYVETPDEFCASLRKVVNPIWKAIFEKKNNFDGHFEPLCQS